MRSDTLTLTAGDGTQLHVYRWLPDGEPTAIVQIAHGMAEHAGRYERFAQALTDHGYAVYAEDHRGHGVTSETTGVGYLADGDGFDTVAEDFVTVFDKASDEFPGLPRVLFGHSMGSMLARHFATKHSDDISALIVSGTAGDPGLLGKAGKVVATLESKVRGKRTPSPLMNKLVFGEYNKAFKPNRTDFDWLSRDEAEVDAYIADPHCGKVFSSGFYADLLSGLDRINSEEHVATVRRDLPILLIAGDKDPVGDNGKGVEAVGAQYEKLGVTDVTVILYPGARHELLNETNRDEVTEGVLSWLEQHLPQ
ncbi:alpha-beta hydrolase superfamily lysophospholipase [Branchiibius hedensis]|uniref:Serine aminopeptidase, S33 n=1 Tax=Branchiibius hedensis TaxID=672460 RepID=A0A2Y9BUL1_9MICO|nr:alpha/beta hydrolase [Branchiibius hedensis]PWJ27091.1 alpha-beta hydrolase superfamily lysophospholipase [Branchiibius hedensis]SSA35902.1 Serine aminopeptidase, S33 [Branchiibius hedensis]